MRLEKRLAERAAEAAGVLREVEVPALYEPVHEGEAVRVQAARRDADERVPRGDAAGPGPRPVDDAHEEAREVVLSLDVDAGHLGGLAAEEGDPEPPAGFGRAGDDLLEDGAVELRRREVVEEEQRLGALHQGVVDAVVDDVRPDPAVRGEPPGELRLRADAVVRGDEHGLLHPRERRAKQARERAGLAEDAVRVRRLDPRRDPLDHRRLRLHVDARVLVRQPRHRRVLAGVTSPPRVAALSPAPDGFTRRGGTCGDEP